MSALLVRGMNKGITGVPNAFIDHYMNSAGATNLKTYLLLLRMMGEAGSQISLAGMADRLDCSESDVVRALKYWEKRGLMTLGFDGAGKLCSLDLQDPNQVYDSNQNLQREKEAAKLETVGIGTEERNGLTEADKDVEDLPAKKVDLAVLSEDEAYREFMYVAESYIGHPLSGKDCETFGWLYESLHMPVSLLEYLVEYCVNNGHNSVRYMEAVALDWHQKKINTVEMAKIYTPLNAKKMYAIMKALGLGNRQPAASERSIIDGWINRMGFSVDMIVEACNRTIITIHEPNLKYVESILNRWKKAGIKSLDQVKELDEAFLQEKTANGGKQEAVKAGESGSGNKPNTGYQGNQRNPGKRNQQNGKKPGAMFHDFEQRQYDYDELLKKLNQ